MFGIFIESGDPKELNVDADLIDDCNICKHWRYLENSEVEDEH